MEMRDLLVSEAQATTNLENVWTEVWADLREEGVYGLAADVRNAGANAEHARAELAGIRLSGREPTAEQWAAFQHLLEVFNELVHRAAGTTGKTYG